MSYTVYELNSATYIIFGLCTMSVSMLSEFFTVGLSVTAVGKH